MLATYFHAGFLIGLFLSPEDGSHMSLRNVVFFSTDYPALYHRRQNSSSMNILLFVYFLRIPSHTSSWRRGSVAKRRDNFTFTATSSEHMKRRPREGSGD
jgi:hypothetical protein